MSDLNYTKIGILKRISIFNIDHIDKIGQFNDKEISIIMDLLMNLLKTDLYEIEYHFNFKPINTSLTRNDIKTTIEIARHNQYLNLDINKYEDEWFYVSLEYGIKAPPSNIKGPVLRELYKCDQIEGLVDFIGSQINLINV